MSTVTTYFNLVKAAVLEAYSLVTTNNNLDAIDTAIHNVDLFSKKIRHAEYNATASAGNTAAQPWDIGPCVVQAGLSVNNTFSTANAASGKIDLTEVGTYSVEVVVKPTANPGLNYVSIRDGADTFFFDLKESGAQIKWENSAKATVYVTAAPYTIFFRTQWATAALPATSVVRINKIAGT